jgi:hypothetical protein
LRLRLSQAFGVADRQILASSVAVMDHAVGCRA